MANLTLHGPDGQPQQPPASEGTAVAAAPQTKSAAPAGKLALLYVTDEDGRQIGWRRLNALEDFDLTEIAGQSATNEEWMLRATVAFGVREIDGDPIGRPTTKMQLRALVARLDTPGMQAILSLLQAEAVKAAEAEAQGKDRAKN